MSGILVALLPFLGFPHVWESFFEVVAGLSIVLLSVWVTIDKRLSLKAKAHRRQIHKRPEVVMEPQVETPVEQNLPNENISQ